jgi:hypothetical protein
MKTKSSKISFYVSALLFLALALSLAMPLQTARAANDWYVATTGLDTNPGTALLPFLTIGHAIGAASDYDTIHVVAGNYTEAMIQLTKPVTLLGAQAGMDARTRGPDGIVNAETVMTYSGGQVFNLNSSYITIDGFMFPDLGKRAFEAYNDADKFTMRNNILKSTVASGLSGDSGNIQFAGGPTKHANNFLFEQNYVQNLDSCSMIYMSHAMDNGTIRNNYINSGAFTFGPFGVRTGWLIEGNEFDGNVLGYGPYYGFGMNANLGNVIIRNNTVSQMSVGIGQISVVGGSITGNTFTDNDYAAFQLWGGEWGSMVSGNVQITNNVFSYNGKTCTGFADAAHGIRLRPNKSTDPSDLGNPSDPNGIDASTIHIQNNSFTNLGVGTCGQAWAIWQQGNPATTADASSNWWGTTSDTAIAALMNGSVDFTPYLDSGTDADPVTAVFQGILSTLNVTALGAQTGLTGRIQEGINLVSGSTVNVAAGTYPENVNLNKRLTLTGAGSGSDPATNTVITAAVANVPVVSINASGASASDRLTISSIRVTGGNGTVAYENSGIKFVSGGSYTTFSNVASVGNQGSGLLARAGTLQDVQILNCTFSDNEAQGFLASGSTLSVEDLTITNTDMNHNREGLYIDSALNGLTLTGGNYNYNHETAPTDGIGIYITTRVTPPSGTKPMVLSGFTASNNVRGVIFSGGVTGPFSITDAILDNNTQEGISFSPNAYVPGPVTLHNVIVTNNPLARSGLWVVSFRNFAFSNLTIEESTFNGSRGTTGTPTQGKGYGILLDVLSGATLSNVTVTNSTMTDNNVGVYMRERDALATLTGVSVVGSSIENNDTGMIISDNATDGNSAHTNNIAGNTVIGIQNNDPNDIFDATSNWWGAVSGPGVIGPGTGDKVSDFVAYTPWCGDSACTPSAQVISGASATVDNGDTVALSNGNASATYSGSGTATADVTLAQYTGNPGGTVTGIVDTGDNFYDLQVTNNTDPDATLTVVFNANAVGDVLRYWNGSDWNTVVSNDGTIPTAQPGTPPQITVVFGPTSQPRLIDLIGTPIVSSSPEAIAVQFTPAQIVQGQQITATVIVKSTNLYGVEVHLTFPVALLRVTQVTLGVDLSPDAVGQNTYNNDLGTIDFAFNQIAPRPAISGDDLEVATILFTAYGSNAGSGELATVDYSAITPTILSDPNGVASGRYLEGGSSNTMDAQPGSVTVVQAATIVGTVTLQGRSDYKGATISVLPGSNLTTTVGSGSFSLSGLIPYGPDGIPGGTSYEVRASFAGYLTAKKSGYEPTAGSNTLSTITLLGGDANRDQVINIQDLAFMGARFGSTIEPQADINGDGTVNILDLTLAGTNFGQAGPQAW